MKKIIIVTALVMFGMSVSTYASKKGELGRDAEIIELDDSMLTEPLGGVIVTNSKGDALTYDYNHMQTMVSIGASTNDDSDVVFYNPDGNYSMSNSNFRIVGDTGFQVLGSDKATNVYVELVQEWNGDVMSIMRFGHNAKCHGSGLYVEQIDGGIGLGDLVPSKWYYTGDLVWPRGWYTVAPSYIMGFGSEEWLVDEAVMVGSGIVKYAVLAEHPETNVIYNTYGSFDGAAYISSSDNNLYIYEDAILDWKKVPYVVDFDTFDELDAIVADETLVNQDTGDIRYVEVAGDVMVGDLSISGSGSPTENYVSGQYFESINQTINSEIRLGSAALGYGIGLSVLQEQGVDVSAYGAWLYNGNPSFPSGWYTIGPALITCYKDSAWSITESAQMGDGNIKFPVTSSSPSSPTKGTSYFDSDDNKLHVWDGTTWQACW